MPWILKRGKLFLAVAGEREVMSEAESERSYTADLRDGGRSYKQNVVYP